MINGGVFLEDATASEMHSSLLASASPLLAGKGLAGASRLLEAGAKASELELFGELFDKVVHELTIEDPHLYEARHERRLKAWLDLPKTAAICVIKTSHPREPDAERQQSAMFSRLKAQYGKKHQLKVQIYPRRDMHDRSVTVVAEDGCTMVSLPGGLDFINDSGIAEKKTSITVMRLPDRR
jgi:hypothetical protein